MFEQLFSINLANKYTSINGLSIELQKIYIYNLYKTTNNGLLVVCNTMYEATKFYESLGKYTDKILLFEMDDFITSEAIAISPELMYERITTLHKLVSDNNYIVVTNLMGYLRYLPTKQRWQSAYLNLKVGQVIDRDIFREKLYNLGYRPVSIVEKTGDIAIRGYVVDIFDVKYATPIRIEIAFDEIESIRFFDIDSQRSQSQLSQIEIGPNSEFLSDVIVEDENKKQKYLPKYLKDVGSIKDYITSDVVAFVAYNNIFASYQLLLEEIFEYNESISKTESYMHDFTKLNFKNEFYLLDYDDICLNEKLVINDNYASKNIDNYHGKIDILLTQLKLYKEQEKTVVFCFDNDKVAQRVINYLEIKDYVLTTIDHIIEKKINIVYYKINQGFIYLNYIVISNNDLFYPKHEVKKYASHYKRGSRISDLKALERGDFVVHTTYGIGIYDGIWTLTKNGFKNDYIKILYLDDDYLYVPIDKVELITKYASKEGVVPKISKLGSEKWKTKKARIKDKIDDMARQILELSALRQSQRGFSFSIEDEYQRKFENEFPYVETKDQLVAVEKIKREMEKTTPMDMLLCGDVGYGKTEVAFRAIFKAINNGKQVAYLCPTTILSNQQYKNAISRFSQFGINVGLLNRFVPQLRQNEIIKKVKEGTIDLVIGTHRLLGNDIEFKDLGLLIIDEEQRFGVTHKEKIKGLKANIDVLTLSATPIPRTLQMSITGLRELALIETPPINRYPIQTYVLAENNKIIKDAIYKELARKGQCFILYNRVNNIEDKKAEIQQLVPDATIDVAHGQMTKDTLENKMIAFINGKTDVLVTTTIIETGIDISNVNTLIVIDADHFGLSQLYQIRGRIGRSNKIGYAYLMYSPHKILNEIAIKRLNTIKEFTALGSGFNIAMRDLSIRGAGDIIGSEQSGFVDSIGIELYLKMVNDAVLRLKGITIEEEKDEERPHIEVNTTINETYQLPDEIKLDINKRIGQIDSYKKISELKDEFDDRFGRVDEELLNYMYESYASNLMNKLDIVVIKQDWNIIELKMSEGNSNLIDGQQLFMDSYDICNKFSFSYKNKCLIVMLNIKTIKDKYIIYITKILELIQTMIKKH